MVRSTSQTHSTAFIMQGKDDVKLYLVIRVWGSSWNRGCTVREYRALQGSLGGLRNLWTDIAGRDWTDQNIHNGYTHAPHRYGLN